MQRHLYTKLFCFVYLCFPNGFAMFSLEAIHVFLFLFPNDFAIIMNCVSQTFLETGGLWQGHAP